MTEIILLISKMIGGNPYIAKALSMVLTIVLNYIFSKLFIFNKRKGTQNENEETFHLQNGVVITSFTF